VPRPRHSGQFISPEFLATKKRLEELIHPPTTDDDADGLHMIRMAHVGDDVEVME
jgi:NitT/TauT family transport system ATP-binding protein